MAAYWKVNSYGYPNPFSERKNPAQATATLDAFLQERRYPSLKARFEAGQPRQIDHAAVESWKATFEEFGILYVLAGDDKIVVTPGGEQLLAAREAGDVDEFARVGLALLLRYPLRGQRRPRKGLQDSDLLLHRAILAAMLDLGGEIWWPEVTHILSQSITRAELAGAVSAIAAIRAGEDREILEHEPPVPLDDRNFYNMLNQVFVHAGLNEMLLVHESSSARFADPEVDYPAYSGSRRVEMVRPSMRPLIEQALGGGAATDCVGAAGRFVDRLPAAPEFDSEEEYFEYAGAAVPPPAPGDGAGPASLRLGEDLVWVLKEGRDYEAVGEAIVGPSSRLCAIGQGQRLLLSHDLDRSRIVDAKALAGDGRVELAVHPGRTISRTDHIIDRLG